MTPVDLPRLDDAELLRLLREDVPYGDLTTRTLGIGRQPGRAVFRARQAMRVCGVEEAARMFELAGADVTLHRASASFAAAGTELLEARGTAAALHQAWKVAQTLVEYASGIASGAAAIVGALHEAGFATPVACTRKNFPGCKTISMKAVLAGGAEMHRLGLSETLLVFPEHRVFLSDTTLLETLQGLKRQCPEKKLVAEVSTVDDALALVAAGVEILQLEKFPPEALAECRESLRKAGLAAVIAAAGGVNRENAVAYAQAGADLLVTSAPYFSRPADVSVTISGE